MENSNMVTYVGAKNLDTNEKILVCNRLKDLNQLNINRSYIIKKKNKVMNTEFKEAGINSFFYLEGIKYSFPDILFEKTYINPILSSMKEKFSILE